MNIELLKKCLNQIHNEGFSNLESFIKNQQIELTIEQIPAFETLLNKKSQIQLLDTKYIFCLRLILIIEFNSIIGKKSNISLNYCTEMIDNIEQIYSLHIQKMELWLSQSLEASFNNKISKSSINLIRHVKDSIKNFIRANQIELKSDSDEYFYRLFLSIFFLFNKKFSSIFSLTETAREKWLIFNQLMIDTSYIHSLEKEIEKLIQDSEKNFKETKISLLLVDDEQTNIDMYTQIVDTSLFQTETANSAEEAIEKLTTQEFQMIVSDLRMETKTGMDILKHINKNKLNIKFILQTGHGTIDLAIQAMKQGAFDFITKPVDLNQLKHIIESCRRQILSEISEKRTLKEEHKISKKNTFENTNKPSKKDDIYELFIEQFKKELLKKDALNLNQEDIFELVKQQTGFQKSYRQFQRWVKLNKGLPISDLLLKDS